MAKLYILLSQSGTLPSKVLKLFTRAEYNHVSISLAPDLKEMYSFGRRYLYFPIPGGFILESKDTGIYRRYPNASIAVVELEISEEKYAYLSTRLKEMYRDKKQYRYNLLGLSFAAFRIIYRKEKRYYCSEFVRDIFVESGIVDADVFQPIVQPIHFIDMTDSKVIYRGKLSGYSV